jgi:hypothetical protein
MNIFVLTQEDAFYIPRLLDHLLERRPDVLGIGIVPGELRRGHARRYLRLMGVRDFVVQGANLAMHRALGLIGRLMPLGRSYSVADAARRHALRWELVPNVNAPAFIESLKHRQVDLIVSVACPQKFKDDILSVARHGAINIHGALLPDYQGLLPSFWVLANGETETGVTVHYMDADIDCGDIILQRRVDIRPDDTVHSLVRRSKIDVGKHLLVEAIEAIDAGRVQRQPMDPARARYFSFPDDAARREFRRRGRRFV